MRGTALRLSIVVAGLTAPAHAQQVTYFGGAAYSVGSYIFDTRSSSFYLSNGLRLEAGRVDLGVSIPVVTQNGGLVTRVAGGVPLPTGGSQSGLIGRRMSGETMGTHERGRSSSPDSTMMSDSTLVFVDEYTTDLGDPYLSVDGELFSGFGRVRSVSVSGMAKIPVSDPDSGVGSGEWDFGAGASVVVAAGRMLLLADAAYWWLGDMPDLELRNGLSYALAASLSAFSGRGSFMVMLTGMSRTIDEVEPPVSVLASLSRAAGERVFLSGGVGLGLTEAAPDFSVNVGWSIRLDDPGP